MRAAVNAIWKSTSTPHWWAAYCGAQGCGKRLARACNEGGRTGPGRKGRSEDDWRRHLEPGYVQGPDGYWRRSRKFRDHHPVRSRRYRHIVGPLMRSEGDDTLALFTDGITTWPAPTPDNERPTETYYLPDKRKASAQLQPGEVAYVICHDPKCQQLNEIGCTPG